MINNIKVSIIKIILNLSGKIISIKNSYKFKYKQLLLS